MTQQTEITLIRHHHNQAELSDNAAAHFTRRGFKVTHRFPFDGDSLDLPVSGVTPTLVLGGAQNVTDIDKHPCLVQELKWIEACIDTSTPLMGICLGAQLIAHALGATVTARNPAECEFGFYEVTPTAAADKWLSKPQKFMQAHLQEFALPDGATQLAFSERYPQQAFRYGEHTYAMQFHPEVSQPIHEDWMNDSWSAGMAAITGAQSKVQQRQLAPRYIDAQTHWFEQALDTLFVT